MMNNFASVDYIITARHYGGSARAYIKQQQINIHRTRGISVVIKDLDRDPAGIPVRARIWQGQWIADCECKGASFVDPEEPIFFCFSCGNRANGNKPRPVVFPPTLERLEIERLLLERPVDDIAGLTDNERAGMARGVIKIEKQLPDGSVGYVDLVRSWEPGQSIDDLHAEQDEAIRAWKKGLKSDVV